MACEPRHPTWFTGPVAEQLAGFHIARVEADPAVTALAAGPGGWARLTYWRLHGSPKVYHSAYSPEFLGGVARQLAAQPAGTECWRILDNTALGEATTNALDLSGRVESINSGRALPT